MYMIYDENTLKGQVKMDHTFSCRVSTCKTYGVLCCYWGPANGPKVGKERILTKISRNPTCILVLSVGILMFYVALRCQVRPWWSWKKACEVAQFPLLLQWWRQPPMPGTSPCNWPFWPLPFFEIPILLGSAEVNVARGGVEGVQRTLKWGMELQWILNSDLMYLIISCLNDQFK